jgi:hypothetical protein
LPFFVDPVDMWIEDGTRKGSGWARLAVPSVRALPWKTSVAVSVTTHDDGAVVVAPPASAALVDAAPSGAASTGRSKHAATTASAQTNKPPQIFVTVPAPMEGYRFFDGLPATVGTSGEP